MNIDMEGLIEELAGLVQKIKQGSASRGEVEAFAAAASELHERAIVLRYKAYELEVFPNRKPVHKTEPEAQVEISELVQKSDPLPVFIEPIQDDLAQVVPVDEEPSFDLFSMDLSSDENPVHEINESTNLSLEEEFKAHFGSDKLVDEFDTELNIPSEFELDNVENEDLTGISSLKAQLEENDMLFDYEKGNAQNVVYQLEDLEESTPETTPSDVVVDAEESDTSTFYEEEYEEEINENQHIESVIPTAQEEDGWTIVQPKEEPIPSKPVQSAPTGELHPLYARLGSGDGSLASRLMGTPLQTLKGAFGLNERFQVIQQLFNGSQENYQSSLEQLDHLDGIDDARYFVSQLALKFNWNADDNLVHEFARKIERRYA